MNIELKLSKLLLDLILARYPDFKKPVLMKWSIHIDRMIRLDKRKPDDIEAVIRWCQGNDFWQNNILSTKKLRDKFDQLFLKMPKKIYEPPTPDCSPSKPVKRMRHTDGTLYTMREIMQASNNPEALKIYDDIMAKKARVAASAKRREVGRRLMADIKKRKENE